jgi:hypothetical protein
MAMDTIQKYAVPLTIGAAIVGIWAALRKTGAPTASVTGASGVPAGLGAGNGSITIPAVAPLAEQLIDPSGLTGTAAGPGYWTNSDHIARGYQNPLSQLPIGGPMLLNGTGLQGTPASESNYANGWLPTGYVSALPPWKNGELASILSSMGYTPGRSSNTSTGSGDGGSGCGCGGACGEGGKTGKSGSGRCPTSKNCNSLMDGAGAAFTPPYKTPGASTRAFQSAVVYSVETQIPSPASVAPAANRSSIIWGLH